MASTVGARADSPRADTPRGTDEAVCRPPSFVAAVRPHLAYVTIAPITSQVRDLLTEVTVGAANGLDQESVVSLDNIRTIPVADLGREIGCLLPHQESELALAIRLAFDLP